MLRDNSWLVTDIHTKAQGETALAFLTLFRKLNIIERYWVVPGPRGTTLPYIYLDDK